MKTNEKILDFYAQPSDLTAAGKFSPWLDALPSEVSKLVGITQGLGIYDTVATDFYGCTIPDARQQEIHLRSFEQTLEQLLALDDQPLTVARAADKRLACRCHNFTRLLVAILRAQGIPARSRCGFGTYFNPPYFEDHWVGEYWNAAEARWVLVDPQFDEVWRTKLKIDHDILDVPRNRFLVAGDAWVRCRAGQADAEKFGIVFANLRGLWFVAGNLVRDVAALNKMEMLPWDVWGAPPRTSRLTTINWLSSTSLRHSHAIQTPRLLQCVVSTRLMAACVYRRSSSMPCVIPLNQFPPNP
ncbi:MAG: transglutaminase-like domain-containing protein [Candidatus Binatia bacterium]